MRAVLTRSGHDNVYPDIRDILQEFVMVCVTLSWKYFKCYVIKTLRK